MVAPQSDDPGTPGRRASAGRRAKRGTEAPWLQPLGSTAPGAAMAGAGAPSTERPWFEGADPLPTEGTGGWFEPPGAHPLTDPTSGHEAGRAWFDEDVDSGPATLATPVLPDTGARTPPATGLPAAAPAATPAPATATDGGSGHIPLAPISRGQRRRAAKPRVRRVTRIVRRVDAWSVFKISLLFYVVLYAVLLVAGVLLWALAVSTGTVDNTESFIQELFGLDTFSLNGRQLFEASWVIGAVLVVAGTGMNVAMAVLFNLISDLTGGVRVTVLEEEVVRRYPVDATARPAANVPRPPGL